MPLSAALEFEKFDTAEALLEANSPVNVPSEVNDPVLCCLCRILSSRTIFRINRPICVLCVYKKNAFLQTGDIPLIEAARKGSVVMLGRLIECKSPINHQNKKGQTALMVGVNNIECARLLLGAGADSALKTAVRHSLQCVAPFRSC